MPTMASILPRVAADATTQPSPAERVAAIARKVRVPPGFASAQRAYRDLQERHIALREQERTLVAQMQEGGGETNVSSALVKRIREVDLELISVGESLKEALSKLFQEREPLTTAVTTALRPERALAARHALTAAMSLLDQLAVLDAIDLEVAAVGGQTGQHPMLHYRAGFEQLLACLRRAAVG